MPQMPSLRSLRTRLRKTSFISEQACFTWGIASEQLICLPLRFVTTMPAFLSMEMC